MAQCTSRQLGAFFKKYFDITPSQYINNLRLNHAKELLCFSSYSITQIAENTGFKSIHYFSRYFKEKTGLSPAEYKSQLCHYLYQP